MGRQGGDHCLLHPFIGFPAQNGNVSLCFVAAVERHGPSIHLVGRAVPIHYMWSAQDLLKGLCPARAGRKELLKVVVVFGDMGSDWALRRQLLGHGNRSHHLRRHQQMRFPENV